MSAKIQVVPSLDGFANGDHVVTTLNGYIYTGVVKQLAYRGKKQVKSAWVRFHRGYAAWHYLSNLRHADTDNNSSL